MADSIDRVFAHALQTVRKIPRSGSARPPAADRLKLYGLYKQSMEGDVEGVMERPSLLPPEEEGDLTREERAEVEKWDAWSSCAGLTRSEAKCKYINALIQTMHTYAYGTPEARELVNELEFVWDQVKSNAAFTTATPSSSGGGSGNTSGNGHKQSNRQPGIDEILGTARTKDGLRVMRPMSDQDEEEEEEEEAEADGREGRESLPPTSDADADADAEPATRPSKNTATTRWQSQVNRALVQITAELAALREVVEARRGLGIWGTSTSSGASGGRRSGTSSRRRGWGLVSMLLGGVWALTKRVVLDSLLLAAVVLLLRYRRDGVEGVVGLLLDWREVFRRRLKGLERAAKPLAQRAGVGSAVVGGGLSR